MSAPFGMKFKGINGLSGEEVYGPLMASDATLRDSFAAQALAGMAAGLTRFRTEPGMEDIIVNRPDDVAQIAYVYADAMLAARRA